MEQMVAALLAWAAWQMGQPAPAAPGVVLAPAEEVAARRYGPGAGKGGARSGGRQVIAVYDRRSATVYLPEDWDGSDLVDRSVLLHELVHHVQAVNRVPAVCAAQWEPQAYELQARWLAAQGVDDPLAAIGVDRLTVKVSSMCWRH